MMRDAVGLFMAQISHNRYEVVRAWHGVKKGDVIEIENIHPALLPNVKLLPITTGVKEVNEVEKVEAAKDEPEPKPKPARKVAAKK